MLMPLEAEATDRYISKLQNRFQYLTERTGTTNNKISKDLRAIGGSQSISNCALPSN